MNSMWNEVQPVDNYQVISNGILHEYDRKVISLLYQPLIGSLCFGLYNTLWNEVEENRLVSNEWTHYHLMNFLSANLREIYDARLKLEGIGLLKTFVKQNGDNRTFIYELQPPLSPEQFFTDGMLNVFLYRQLGHAHFLRLKKFFLDTLIDKTDYREITRSFHEVFDSKGDNQYIQSSDADIASVPEENEQFIFRSAGNPVKAENHSFDFELFMISLNELMVPKAAITSQVKEAIFNLSFLYNIQALDMKNLILSALNAEQEIEIDALRKAARDWYQLEHSDSLPQLVDRVQSPIYRSQEVGKAATQEEKLVEYLENTSPRQVLVDISEGAEPSKSDLQAIEEIMFAQKLSAGVMNVLIQYSMLKTDMKLSKNYMEKIASHWSRKKVKTVIEAMELAKNEHRQYQQWAENKKESKTSNRKQTAIRKEKLPEWFSENEEVSLQKTPSDNETIEEKRKRLKSIQKKYKGGR